MVNAGQNKYNIIEDKFFLMRLMIIALIWPYCLKLWDCAENSKFQIFQRL